MKRDMNLVRKILLFTEARPSINEGAFLKFDGHTEDQIWYHANMLVEAGYLDRDRVIESFDGIQVTGDAITFAGHDFLDTVRNDAVWRKTMDKVGSAVGSASLDIIKAIAEGYAKQLLGIG
jgi:hypothetical protein